MNRQVRRDGGLWASWSLSILLHAGIVAIAVGLWFWSRRSEPPARLALEGTVVTGEELARQSAPAPLPEPEPEPVAPEPEPEPAPDEPSPEELAATRQVEEARVAEERRIAEEQLAAERTAREEAEREKAERARREKERADRDKAERERIAKEKVERERQERERADRDRRESDLAAQLAAEQQRDAVRGSAQASQYKALIASRIERAWLQFSSIRPGLVCEVRVTQVPGGAVTGVRVGRCNGDESVRQSLEAAVYRASPLPQPPDQALFERELDLTFRKD